MGRKTRDPEKYARYVAPVIAARRAGEGMAKQSEEEKVMGLDSKGQPVCKHHLSGQLFFGCTCGAMFGKLYLGAEARASCGCVGEIKPGGVADTCVVLRKHQTSDLICAGTWHSDFGSPRTWSTNYLAAVKVMWTFRHSAMSIAAVDKLLGSGSNRPFVQAVDVILLFMGAGELVLTHGLQVVPVVRPFLAGENWVVGTTDRNRAVLQPLYAVMYRGFRSESRLMQAFSLARKCYPTAKVGFHWMLSHMHVTPDDVLSFFSVVSGCVGDVRSQIQRRVREAKLVSAASRREFGDVKFVMGHNGKIVMSKTVRAKLRTGQEVLLLRELPLPTEMGEQTFKYVQDTVQLVGFVDKGGGELPSYGSLRWLDLADTYIPLDLERDVGFTP